ncbi:hypothetical protein [Petropleomorpha daqingensis]|uniref:Meckel syndrome type 1 protein n=1 Tax=Petropleomorpha daqingensis TaxID=2026353 RepID=A0A853CEM9_9ACTN|nr:hypothetical protein [Petropleomorpha daqingensis]NYJ06314.1 hypothetical protein [Petropleomorpha daqingensis]
MPLRSVEAATRDDAIAAAREQFGATARVVGVRRVRSGGVLGFFATERYVAEVDPDALARPKRPAPRTPASRTPQSDLPLEERARAAAASIARLAAAAEDPVDEVADLLGADGPAEPLPTYTRSAFQRAAAESAKKSAVAPAAAAAKKATRAFTPERAFSPEPVKPVVPVHEWPTVETDDEGPVISGSGASSAPSPFTAALARMVSGDREVRQAVQEALEEPAVETAPEPADEHRDHEPSRPNWAAIVRAAEKTAQSGAQHQEEEPVDEHEEQSPGVRPMVFPTWAAEAPVAEAPAPAPAPVVEEPAPSSSPREEVIADILRAALAQGQSDEALADILRTVLAGSSPAAVEAPLPAAAAAETFAEPFSEPVVESFVEPVVETSWEPAPEPAVEPQPLWGDPAPAAPVWTEAAPVEAEPTWTDVTPDEPIFAEVVLHEPAAPVAAPPVVEVPVEVVPVAVAPEPVAIAEPVEEPVVELPMPPLARTASDPAPMQMDATTVMSPLSLLPPLSGRRGGLPPVPPSASRASASAATPRPTTPETAPMPAPAAPLATVVRLPFAPLPDADYVEPGEPAAPVAEVEVEVEETPMSQPVLVEPVVVAAPVIEAAAVEAPAVEAPALPATAPVPAAAPSGDLVTRLVSFGLTEQLLGAGFAADAAAHGTYAALTAALAVRLPAAPQLPTGPGEVLFLVGPGVETLRAARSLAASLRLDPERVLWATRGDLAALAPKGNRITTLDAAIGRRQDAERSGTMTIVAVDAPLRTDAYWMSQMLAIWSPTAVWAVVEATRKPEDLEQWLGGLPRADALVVQDADLSVDPAAVLARVDTPVALLDGVPATAHRWASVLCERLETLQA